jgi:hypothetical protein
VDLWYLMVTNIHVEGGFHVRQTSGVSALQPIELQGILQSETLCFRPQGQGLPQKKETEIKSEIKGMNAGARLVRHDPECW